MTDFQQFCNFSAIAETLENKGFSGCNCRNCRKYELLIYFDTDRRKNLY